MRYAILVILLKLKNIFHGDFKILSILYFIYTMTFSKHLDLFCYCLRIYYELILTVLQSVKSQQQ